MNFVNNKKLRKFRLKGIKINNKKLHFGFYGLISLETGHIDLNMVQSLIMVLKRKIKLKKGKFWFSLNTSIPVTKLSIGTRMGKGKGSISKYVSFVRKGHIICELSLLDKNSALSILKLVSSKLPLKTRIVVY
jgi:large subunit ribosomal protein L16